MTARDIPRLGRCECCGAPIIREVERSGCSALPIAERARRAIATEIEGCPEDCWRFFAAIWHDDIRRCEWSAERLAVSLAVVPTTLMSRFFRAELPTPRMYIAWARLVRAAAVLEEVHGTWVRAAYDLGASSPQSLGRTLRHEWGVSSVQLRDRGSDWALEKYVATLVRPYAATLRAFRPLTAHHPGIAPLAVTRKAVAA